MALNWVQDNQTPSQEVDTWTLDTRQAQRQALSMGTDTRQVHLVTPSTVNF